MFYLTFLSSIYLELIKLVKADEFLSCNLDSAYPANCRNQQSLEILNTSVSFFRSVYTVKKTKLLWVIGSSN